MYFSKAAVMLTLVILPVATVNAQDTAGEIAELRQLVSEMRSDYETRISALEARLVAAERAARGAERDAEEAYEIAEQTAVDQGAGTSAPIEPRLRANEGPTTKRNGTRHQEESNVSHPTAKSFQS